MHQFLVADDPVLLTARLDVNDERRVLIANNIESLLAVREKTAKEAWVTLSAERCTAEKLERLKHVLREHAGACPVKLLLKNAALSETILSLPQEISVEPSSELCNQIEQLFGEPVMSFR